MCPDFGVGKIAGRRPRDTLDQGEGRTFTAGGAEGDRVSGEVSGHEP
jgi:hypothetical protein